MLGLISDPRPWFAPKRYGFGAGLPIAWQGWALIASYLMALGGIGLFARQPGAGPQTAAFALFLIATCLFAVVTWKRTQGGWRWRWGGK